MDAPTMGMVIPTWNGMPYLREAIDSVLLQRWPGVRVLVMDGGSTDGTVDLLRSFGSALEWVSEKDGGQADAIQRGFERLDVELVGWLNADDRLLPGSLGHIARAASEHPDAVLYHGNVEVIEDCGRVTWITKSIDLDQKMVRESRGRIVQPGSFYRRTAVRAAGGVRAEYHLLMDLDLWIRLLGRGPACRIEERLAQFRIHRAAKSSQPPWRYCAESFRIASDHDSRIVRGRGRRLVNVSKHLVQWKMGIKANNRRSDEPPRPKPVVWIGDDVSAVALEMLKVNAVVRNSSEAPEARPDVVVHRVDAVPRRGILGRTAAARPQYIGYWPESFDLALDEHSLLDIGLLSAVVASKRHFSRLRALGLPEFRILDERAYDAWLQAVDLACGHLPGLRAEHMASQGEEPKRWRASGGSGGRLVTFSGVDGSGKSTQIRHLVDELARRGEKPVVLWFRPGYSKGLDAVRAAVRKISPSTLPVAGDGEGHVRAFKRPWVRNAWVALALADTVGALAVTIRGHLLRGHTVVCDRWIPDAILDLVLRFPEVLPLSEVIESSLSALCPRPDLSVLLWLPVAEMEARLALKKEPFPDSAENRLARFRGYERFAAAGKLAAVDARGAEKDVAARIASLVAT